ncbi:MAG: hypothetical protein DWQ31_15210 [Planctomycetota bacterium]|nr:MAG: hypothetical protein DWQ31_15210 [Planctomycetota bacterium]
MGSSSSRKLHAIGGPLLARRCLLIDGVNFLTQRGGRGEVVATDIFLGQRLFAAANRFQKLLLEEQHDGIGWPPDTIARRPPTCP